MSDIDLSAADITSIEEEMDRLIAEGKVSTEDKEFTFEPDEQTFKPPVENLSNDERIRRAFARMDLGPRIDKSGKERWSIGDRVKTKDGKTTGTVEGRVGSNPRLVKVKTDQSILDDDTVNIDEDELEPRSRPNPLRDMLNEKDDDELYEAGRDLLKASEKKRVDGSTKPLFSAKSAQTVARGVEGLLQDRGYRRDGQTGRDSNGRYDSYWTHDRKSAISVIVETLDTNDRLTWDDTKAAKWRVNLQGIPK